MTEITNFKWDKLLNSTCDDHLRCNQVYKLAFKLWNELKDCMLETDKQCEYYKNRWCVIRILPDNW